MKPVEFAVLLKHPATLSNFNKIPPPQKAQPFRLGLPSYATGFDASRMRSATCLLAWRRRPSSRWA